MTAQRFSSSSVFIFSRCRHNECSVAGFYFISLSRRHQTLTIVDYFVSMFLICAINWCASITHTNSPVRGNGKARSGARKERGTENSELLWQRAAQRCSQLVTDVTSSFRVLYHFFLYTSERYSSYRIQFIAQQCHSIALASLL